MTDDLQNWAGCKHPGQEICVGSYAIIEPYQRQEHLEGLFAAVGGQDNAEIWHYMPIGPFLSEADFANFLCKVHEEGDWETLVIKERASGEILGMFSLMRIRAEHGSAEVGCVAYGPKLKRTRIATEALYLLAAHLFDNLGYRRFEWKCNSANQASMNAAIRYGFRFEGVFRNDMVSKGVNRDTAWYAMIDSDWPALKVGYQAWFEPENFDENLRQQKRLQELRN
ncbi:GNAT family N-acetyltransferase [Kordiimonas laminariae]|uniref:GNAT family N-acetyltransferase n=1 Tax=Kordiimonas laminariae TaxID=2917717 RepID=UPI001FF4B2B3|nr:GNAT family protein [Kordiimonas laminariae]MCK0069269.1 GNAT family N-acetyltransferase [Kordiimonas laminariae]